MDDFLIIGGGIAGVSAAAALAPLGQVTLLEAEAHLATQTSARSAALFLEPYGPPPVLALNTASHPHLRAADVLTPRPLLMLARGEDADLFEREVQAFGGQEISVDAALDRLPILNPAVVARAALYDGPSDIDTDKLIQLFARRARQAGAHLHCNRPVTEITAITGGWQVEAGGETVSARVVVNAAGAWADLVAQMAGLAPLGLQPMRRSMARLAAPLGHDTRTWPVCLDITEGWYARPDAGAWIVSPAEAEPMDPHDAWADDMVIAEGLARYQDFVTAEVTRPLATWAGLRTFSPDGALVLGREPAAPTFVWCAGQGGYGFQTAPAAAQLLADTMAERSHEVSPEVVQALSPARFR